MKEHWSIADALKKIFSGIEDLHRNFPNRKFTIDGRLVGDIGEVIASLCYDVMIDDISRPGHDGQTSAGRRVQIKATFKDTLTFRSTPELYLGLKLFPDGSFEEVYNGPGSYIQKRYAHRKGLGKDLLSFPISQLRSLSEDIPATERVPRVHIP